MNWQQMIEWCLEANPNRGDTFVRQFMNIALTEFAEQTKLIKKSTTFTGDANTYTFTLPTDCVQVDRITVPISSVTTEIIRSGPHKYNLFEGNYTWWIRGETIYIGKITDGEIGGVAATYTCEYTGGFTELESGTDLSTEPDVPKQFRLGICARVRHHMVNDVQQRGIEHSMWMDAVKRGINMAQQNHDNSPFRIIVHEL